MKLGKKLILGSCVPVALTILLALVAFQGINALVNSNEWVDHTHRVISKADSIQSSAIDMETGMRGYLLAGKEEFLAPYNDGESQFHEKIQDLKETVADNPPQVQLLGEIETTIAQWQENVAEPTISLRRRIGNADTMNDMAKLVGQAKGKVYFDSFREQIAVFSERERALMADRRKAANDAAMSAKESLKTVSESREWVKHTYEVIDDAKDVLASAVDMETGMRGFLLAGKDEFLEPYNSGKSSFYRQVAELKENVADNPQQVKLLDEIEANISDWNESVTEPVITMRRNIGAGEGMEEIVEVVREARGKKFFDKFRDQIAIFISREEQLLEQRGLESATASSSVANSIKVIGETSNWVDHTHEVIAEAESLLASAVDMETGMRGFLLAGKEEFLDPYHEGRERQSCASGAFGRDPSDHLQLAGTGHRANDHPPQENR